MATGRLAVALAVLALAVPMLAQAAPATITRVAFTAVVSPNDYARLEVRVSPRARCSITVIYDTTESHAAGLRTKAGGRIVWRWKVGSSTHPGRWPVRVNCGTSGKRTFLLRVRSS